MNNTGFKYRYGIFNRSREGTNSSQERGQGPRHGGSDVQGVWRSQGETTVKSKAFRGRGKAWLYRRGLLADVIQSAGKV